MALVNPTYACAYDPTHACTHDLTPTCNDDTTPICVTDPMVGLPFTKYVSMGSPRVDVLVGYGNDPANQRLLQ